MKNLKKINIWSGCFIFLILTPLASAVYHQPLSSSLNTRVDYGFLTPTIPIKSFENDNWISYDSKENVNAIRSSAGTTFEWGIRLTPEELGPYHGQKLSVVRHYHGWSGDTTPFLITGTVKIYDARTPVSPGMLLSSEPFTANTVGWFDVQLTNPVTIDGGKDLWICIATTPRSDVFPAGVGPGPTVPRKGGWITTDGMSWWEISDRLLEYNWNLWAGINSGLQISWVSGGFGVKAEITNNGDSDLQNIMWHMTVTGDIMSFITTNRTRIYNGTISTLQTQGKQTIHSGFFLGLGTIQVQIFVNTPSAVLACDAVHISGVALGPFIFVIKK